MVLPATDIEGATAVAEQMREAVEAISFTFEGKKVPLTISAGVAEWRPAISASSDASKLVHTADQRLYQAKASGRNVVCAKEQLRAAS